MQRRTLLVSITGTIALPGLTGCVTTTPRTKEDDRAISSVLVCSLLDPRIEILTLGITVFGNKASVLEPNAILNKSVDQALQEVLKRNRPNWTVTQVAQREQLDAKVVSFGTPGRFRYEQAQDELRSMLQDSKADLLFALLPETGEGVRIPGLSIEFRNSIASPTISSRVYVLNRDMKLLTQRALFTSGFNDTARPSLKIATDLHAPGTTEDKQRVVQATIEYGANSVKSALKVLGYGDA
jgi:hypothetical protein